MRPKKFIPLLCACFFILFQTAATAETTPNLGVINFPKDDERTVAYLNELQAGFLRWNVVWEDLEPEQGVYRFTSLGQQMTEFPGRGILIMISTRNPIYCAPYCTGDSRLETYPQAGGMPSDLAAYERFITAFVDQFGNGIAFLQIDNEINEYGIYWQDSVQHYKEVLASAYRAVKQSAYPSLPVVAAGFSSGHTEKLIQGDPWATALTEDVLAAGNFDYLDIHLYHRYQDIDAKVNWLRSRGFNHLITTECGGPDTEVGDYSAIWEAEKARQLIKRFAIAMQNGLEQICWFSFINLPREIPRFAYLGLVDENFVRKPAFYTYKMLISKIGNADRVQKVATGKYVFDVNGGNVLVLWNDSKTEILDASTFISTKNARVTRIITEDGKTDADAEVSIVPSRRITIDATPVFVEEEKTIIHDIAATAIRAPAPIILGDVAAMGIDVANLGNVAETFAVQLNDLTDATTIGQQDTGLNAGTATTVTFNWNTSGATVGEHLLEAVAVPVTGETNTANNATQAAILVQEAAHDVAITAISAPQSASLGAIIGVSVTVVNEGTFSESTSIELTDTTTGRLIASQTVALLAGQSQTVDFSWDTTAEPVGGHLLRAAAPPVTGETDLSDNSATTTITLVETPKLHVAGIEMSIGRAGSNWGALARVSVKDSAGAAVAAAAVTGQWALNGKYLKTVTQVADSAGVAVLRSPKSKVSSGDVFTFLVTNIVKDGYSYDAAANVESSASIAVP